MYVICIKFFYYVKCFKTGLPLQICQHLPMWYSSHTHIFYTNPAAFICVEGVWILYVTCDKQHEMPSELLVTISSVVASATSNLYCISFVSSLATLYVISSVLTNHY